MSIGNEEFQKLPKLDQLIIYFDNKTYRSNNSFRTDVWKELEDEFMEMLKLKS